VFAATAGLTTGDGKAYLPIPSQLDGWTLIDADAYVSTVGSNATTVQLARERGNTSSPTVADMLSTKITIDGSEHYSYFASTQPVINSANADLATGDAIRVDVDGAGSGAKGLVIILEAEAP
jgi:hypothetical protein